MSDEISVVPDPEEMKRIGANINRAREMIPDNPAGLKLYIGQWILPTMALMFKQVMSLAQGSNYALGGLQHLNVQVQQLSHQEGIMELASYVAGLREVLSSDPVNMEAIRNTVSAMELVLEERFLLNLGGDFDFEEGEDEMGDGSDPVSPETSSPASTPSLPIPAPMAADKDKPDGLSI